MFKAWKTPGEMLNDPDILPPGKAMMREALAKGQTRLVERLLQPYLVLPTPEEIIELTTDVAKPGAACGDSAFRFGREKSLFLDVPGENPGEPPVDVMYMGSLWFELFVTPEPTA